MPLFAKLITIQFVIHIISQLSCPIFNLWRQLNWRETSVTPLSLWQSDSWKLVVWKCYKIRFWWSLYNYNCNEIHWVTKRKKNRKKIIGWYKIGIYKYDKMESNFILLVIMWVIWWTLRVQAGVVRNKTFLGASLLENKEMIRNVVED